MSEPMSRAQELQRAFDAAFALPVQAEAPLLERFLSVSIGSETLALELSGNSARISTLVANRPLVSLASEGSGFLGLAGIRGEIVPVFNLAWFAGSSRRGTGHWLAVLRLPAPAAVAFDGMNGLLELPAADIVTSPATGARQFIRRIAQRSTGRMPILDLDAVAEAIRVTARRSSGPALEAVGAVEGR